MSQKVAIVTDSSACIPAELASGYGIGVVPMSVIFDGRTYRDGVDMSPTEFYSLLRRVKNLPTTAHSSPGAHLEAFRRASQIAPNILCITLSGHFSGQCQSARVAREMAKEALPGVAIEVMDSGTAAAAEGFVVLAAAREAERGSGLAEVAARASALFRIKPILTLNDGEAHALARVRTTPRAIGRMMEILRGRACPPPLHVAVMQADALENALALKERIAAAFAPEELLLTEFTPVMGAHIGPGLIGVAFYGGE